jgi:hypothetical protein
MHIVLASLLRLPHDQLNLAKLHVLTLQAALNPVSFSYIEVLYNVTC